MHPIDLDLLGYAERLLAGTGVDPRTIASLTAEDGPTAAALRDGWDTAQDGDQS